MAHPSEAQTRLFVQAEHWFDRSRAALLGEIPCRRGCSRCCIGPFAITTSDAVMMQQGLGELSPKITNDIQERAQQQIVTIDHIFPRLAHSPYLDEWTDPELDQVVTRFADLPCPALDANGCCRIYRFRPLTCRTMGLPIQTGDFVHGACEVQTAVPIIPLSRALRDEEDRLAALEAAAIASHPGSGEEIGEELLLPYGFVHDRTHDRPVGERQEF